MRNNSRGFLLIGGLVLLLALLFYFFGNEPDRTNWTEHYRNDSKDPYGTYLIHELIPDYRPEQPYEEIEERFDSLDASVDNANYVYIGDEWNLDSNALQGVLDFVDSGNTAFLSVKNIPYALANHLAAGVCDEWAWHGFTRDFDTTATLQILQPRNVDTFNWELKFQYRQYYDLYDWAFIEPGAFCGEGVYSRLGTIWNDEVNYISMDYGDGRFLFHSTPIAFTNYFLKEPEGLEYASRVFSHLSPGPIYWDGYTLINGGMVSMDDFGSQRAFDSEGPLSFILSQRSLRWAWYILLGGVLLFLAFRAKRRQRVIPVLEPNRNTSLEFITNIGRLYFLRPNHRRLALEQMRLFHLHIRSRYHLQGRDADEDYIRQLSTRSGVEQDAIESIFQVYRNIKGSPSLSENALITFHQKLEYFYQNCK